jgi:hypothetical protein
MVEEIATQHQHDRSLHRLYVIARACEQNTYPLLPFATIALLLAHINTYQHGYSA